MTLKEILVAVHGRAKVLGARIDRESCRLVAERWFEADLENPLRVSLLAAAEGREPFEGIRKNPQVSTYFAVEWVREMAERAVLQEYARELGSSPLRKTAWEVVADEFFAAAPRVADGFKYVNRQHGPFWDGQLWLLCEFLSSGESTPPTPMDRNFLTAYEALERSDFASALLVKLHTECPQEAADPGLSGIVASGLTSRAEAENQSVSFRAKDKRIEMLPPDVIPFERARIKVSEVAVKVSRTKGAVEKALKANTAPKPCVRGKVGQPYYYDWGEMRAFCQEAWKIDIGAPPKRPPT